MALSCRYLTLAIAVALLPVAAPLDDDDGGEIWRETGFPGEWSKSECRDDDAECGGWQATGECRKAPFYMLFSCKRTCLPQCNGWTKDVHRGKATREMTRAFVTSGPGQKAAQGFFHMDSSLGSFASPGQRVRGAPWLHISSLGVGTYQGDLNMQTDLEVASAIMASVEGGWNVIDTASNWRGGRAEACVGIAMDVMMHHPDLDRRMLFVVTRAGFTGTEGVMDRLQAAGGAPTSAEVNGNCIHPACLRASLDTSLARMHLDTVDVLLLHNAAEEQLRGLSRAAFMLRLEEAFAYLEEERRAGRIQAFGMATWSCFRVPPTSPEYVSLAEVVALAAKVYGGRNHGFRYIQIPVNAVMPEAWTEKWQLLDGAQDPQEAAGSEPEQTEIGNSASAAGTEGMGTILEAAARLGVGVFGSAPLKGGEIFWERGMRKKIESNVTEDLLGGPSLRDPGTKLLHLARSAPTLLASIVGHKSFGHVTSNTQLSQVKPLPRPSFYAAYRGFAEEPGGVRGSTIVATAD